MDAAIEKIDSVTPGPFRQGTSWQETRKAGKRTMQSTLSVASFDPPKRLGLHVEGKVMKGDLSFTLAPKAGATEVTYEAQMWGKGLMRLMSRTMNRMMADEDNDTSSSGCGPKSKESDSRAGLDPAIVDSCQIT